MTTVSIPSNGAKEEKLAMPLAGGDRSVPSHHLTEQLAPVR
jgi:hypothetical protein